MDKQTPDAAIAEAMNRVLAAEREAAEAIAAAQCGADAVIEAARARRRCVLESARRRATGLHVKAESRLRQALAELEGGAAEPGHDTEALRSLAQEAISGLARRLTSVDHEPR